MNLLDCQWRYRLYVGHKKHERRCFEDSRPCSLWRLGWCMRYIPLAILILAVGLYFGIGLVRAAMDRTENQIVTFGPSDWREKEADCERRAKLLGNCYIEYVDGDRYCVVRGGEI